MPRSGDLLGLSREHHAALVLARDCERARPEDVAALDERIHAHHDDLLVRHFADEEALVARAAVPGPLSAAFHRDHAWLRAWIAAAPRNAESIREYGARLRAHVRFEERVLFPVLQA